MNTLDDLFGLWPTVSDLARDIGRPVQTVSSWKSRKSIPGSEFVAITNAAGKRGFDAVTVEAVANLCARTAPTESEGAAA